MGGISDYPLSSLSLSLSLFISVCACSSLFSISIHSLVLNFFVHDDSCHLCLYRVGCAFNRRIGFNKYLLSFLVYGSRD